MKPGPEPHPELAETSRDGRSTRLLRLTAGECPALALQGLDHVGTGDAGAGFCMIRTHLPGAFLIGTIGGEGWVRADGGWRLCRPGMVCLSPPQVLQGCHAARGSRWQFVWCRWDQGANPAALARPDTPLLRAFDADPLHAIVTALAAEQRSHAHPTVLHHLVEALMAAVWNFTGAHRTDARLAMLWQAVEQQPAEAWTVGKLAMVAGCSREHLRRLCQEQLGRSPQEQLAWVRLRHAARLLSATDEKLESIARDSGYSSAFALSNAFVRWMGCRPRDVRSR